MHTQPPALEGWFGFLIGALAQPLSLDVCFEPSPVVGLITEALGFRGKVLGLLGWNATVVDVDGHSFFKGLDVRDEGWVCYSGSAHALASHSLLRSGNLTPSTISRFCA